VPDDWQAEALAREGVSRGRIWTARELGALVALPDRTPEIVHRLALAKRAVDGDVVLAGPGERAGVVTVLEVGEEGVRIRRGDGSEELLALP